MPNCVKTTLNIVFSINENRTIDNIIVTRLSIKWIIVCGTLDVTCYISHKRLVIIFNCIQFYFSGSRVVALFSLAPLWVWRQTTESTTMHECLIKPIGESIRSLGLVGDRSLGTRALVVKMVTLRPSIARQVVGSMVAQDNFSESLCALCPLLYIC